MLKSAPIIKRSLKIDAEVLVVLGVGIGQLVRTAIDGHRFRKLEDFFAAGRLVMKIEQRRAARVHLALPGTGKPENIGFEHVVSVSEMKDEAADGIADETIERGRDAAHCERQVMILAHRPIAV